MENIKPEMPLKCSMSREKNICVCFHILFKEFLRLMESFFLDTHTKKKKKLGKYYQCNFFSRTQKFLFKSCVYKLMHIHKVIHSVGTYSHPEAVKKLQL